MDINLCEIWKAVYIVAPALYIRINTTVFTFCSTYDRSF